MKQLSLGAALAFALLAPPGAQLTAQTPTPTTDAALQLGKMWLFERPPLEYLAEEYGEAPTGEWLAKLQLATLRFGGGCSASFVSPQGLILTNHHCVRSFLSSNQGEFNWVRDGFVATSMDEEVRLQGLSVTQHVKTRDVTDQVLAGIAPDMAPEAAATLRAANTEKVLEAARESHPDLQPKVVPLFQGARHHLYLSKVYDDVRLVMAPHQQAAHFGGDFDNFTYPRFASDFSFCRAYEDGKPAATAAHYLKWSAAGASEGDPIYLSGNPGSTERLLTKAQMESLRNSSYPILKELIDNRLKVMRAVASADESLEKQLNSQILRYENGQKVYHWELKALRDPRFMERKAALEDEFRRRIEADPALSSRFAGLLDRVAQVAVERTRSAPKLRFWTTGGCLQLRVAQQVLAAREARLAGDEERFATLMAEVEKYPAEAFDPDLVTFGFFADHLGRARSWLKANDRFLALAYASPMEAPAVAARSISSSPIGAQEYRAAVLGADADTFKKLMAEDRALRVAAFLNEVALMVEQIESDLSSKEEALGTELGQALFAVYGEFISPDATGTMRFSDGRVMGYAYNGTKAPAQTVLHGLFAREAEFGGEHPFDLPVLWHQRKGQLNLTTPINFVCTCDSTGGNSGSPIVNADLELIGLLFDGNIESMPNQFLYDEAAGRSVAVHVKGIVEVLKKVYDCGWITEELGQGR